MAVVLDEGAGRKPGMLPWPVMLIVSAATAFAAWKWWTTVPNARLTYVVDDAGFITPPLLPEQDQPYRIERMCYNQHFLKATEENPASAELAPMVEYVSTLKHKHGFTLHLNPTKLFTNVSFAPCAWNVIGALETRWLAKKTPAVTRLQRTLHTTLNLEPCLKRVEPNEFWDQQPDGKPDGKCDWIDPFGLEGLLQTDEGDKPIVTMSDIDDVFMLAALLVPPSFIDKVATLQLARELGTPTIEEIQAAMEPKKYKAAVLEAQKVGHYSVKSAKNMVFNKVEAVPLKQTGSPLTEFGGGAPDKPRLILSPPGKLAGQAAYLPMSKASKTLNGEPLLQCAYYTRFIEELAEAQVNDTTLALTTDEFLNLESREAVEEVVVQYGNIKLELGMCGTPSGANRTTMVNTETTMAAYEMAMMVAFRKMFELDDAPRVARVITDLFIDELPESRIILKLNPVETGKAIDDASRRVMSCHARIVVSMRRMLSRNDLSQAERKAAELLCESQLLVAELDLSSCDTTVIEAFQTEHQLVMGTLGTVRRLATDTDQMTQRALLQRVLAGEDRDAWETHHNRPTLSPLTRTLNRSCVHASYQLAKKSCVAGVGDDSLIVTIGSDAQLMRNLMVEALAEPGFVVTGNVRPFNDTPLLEVTSAFTYPAYVGGKRQSVMGPKVARTLARACFVPQVWAQRYLDYLVTKLGPNGYMRNCVHIKPIRVYCRNILKQLEALGGKEDLALLEDRFMPQMPACDLTWNDHEVAVAICARYQISAQDLNSLNDHLATVKINTVLEHPVLSAMLVLDY